jgi:hypothetical protein
VTNQYDNLNNSKEDKGVSALTRTVWAVTAIIGCAVLAASVTLPSALSGRLHPGLVPGALATICLLAALVGVLRPRIETLPDANCLPAGAVSLRGLAAAIAAIALLALATRPLGAPIAVSAAGALAALGMRGIGFARAIPIGLALGFAATLVFVVLLRQPLPLWPGRW